MTATEARRKLRKTFEPTPEGWLVTGHVQLGDFTSLSPVARCAGHLFITREAVASEHWQSGWVQGAVCVVCDEEITPIDGTWWKDIATPAKIRATRNLIRRKRQSLQEALAFLGEHLDSGDYDKA